MKKNLFLFLSLAAILFVGCQSDTKSPTIIYPAVQNESNTDLIRWWPRIKPVSIPKNLKQFAVLEFLPELKLQGDVTVKIEFPQGIVFDSIVTAWANPDKPLVSSCPPPPESAYPESAVQEGNILIMKFKAGSFNVEPQTWVTMVINVGEIATGSCVAKIEVSSSAGQNYAEEIELDIRPALTGVQSKTPLIMWNFQGLDDQFIPVYMDGMVKSGVNAFYEMREETPGKTAGVDYQKEFNTIHGTAFFGERIGKYFEKNGLPEELKGRTDIVYDNAWLLDNPDVMEIFLKYYYEYLMDGKEFQVVIYDAERGSFKSGGSKIVGDLTNYSLAKFGREYNISAAELIPEIITEKYSDQWIKYNCDQSMLLAKIAKETAKKYYPNATFEVYSGYEYDDAPYENLTRKNYAVDWKTMKEAGMDAAGCGYFGDYKLLAHTANAVKPVCNMLPAEMYMESFRTTGVPMPRLNVENFTFRLIGSYLTTGGKGIQLWYGATMHGGALVALDHYTTFANLTSDFLADAERMNNEFFLRITPRAFAQNVYMYQNGSDTMVILLNPTDKATTVRLAFIAEIGKEYTDLASGKTGKAEKLTTIQLEPYSYEIRVYKK